jgi:hypothetical protein
MYVVCVSCTVILVEKGPEAFRPNQIMGVTVKVPDPDCPVLFVVRYTV